MSKRKASSNARPEDWAWLDALDRGEFKEFNDADDLKRYLNKIAKRAIRKSAKQISPTAGSRRFTQPAAAKARPRHMPR
jgi:hypothetical protein